MEIKRNHKKIFFYLVVFFIFLILFLNLFHFFTLIILPDTQNYFLNKENYNAFLSQINFIKEYEKVLNIKKVIHLGDIINDLNNNNEWLLAKKGFDLLKEKNTNINIIFTPGNHDIYNYRENTFLYNKYTDFTNQKNTFLINRLKLDRDYIFLSVNFDPLTRELEDLKNQLFNENQNYVGFYISHIFLNDKSGLRFNKTYLNKLGLSPEEIWRKFIFENCNIRFVLSGHSHIDDGENILISKNKCKKDVYQLIQNYQDRNNGGDGYLRIFFIFYKLNKILVLTYSPFLNKVEFDKDSFFIFDIK